MKQGCWFLLTLPLMMTLVAKTFVGVAGDDVPINEAFTANGGSDRTWEHVYLFLRHAFSSPTQFILHIYALFSSVKLKCEQNSFRWSS